MAFEQEFTHGSAGVHYELRNVATGRLVAHYEPPADVERDPGGLPKNAPSWVKEFESKRR